MAAYEESLRSLLRSSTFLGMNAFLVIFLFCGFRAALGRFYYTLCAFLPSFSGSLLAILWERPSRRRALAFYVANVASESAYRILSSRGYIRPIPHGQLMMSAIAIVSLLMLHEANHLKDPLISFVLNLVTGHVKQKTNSQKKERDHTIPKGVENVEVINDYDEESYKDKDENCDKDKSKKEFAILPHKFKCWLQEQRQMLKGRYKILAIKNQHCHHQDFSCAEDIMLLGFGRSFLMGWAAAVAWQTIPKMLNFRLQIQAFRWSTIKVGMSLATFSIIYRSVRCFLRHQTNRNDYSSLACLLAGSLAFGSLNFVTLPGGSLPLYLLWKAIEAYFEFTTRRYMPCVNGTVPLLLYSLATAQLFYAAVLEPKYIKSSYKRFLDRVTENKLSQINRPVLEVFGTNSSAGYETLEPEYLLHYTTKHFQESVLVWLI